MTRRGLSVQERARRAEQAAESRRRRDALKRALYFERSALRFARDALAAGMACESELCARRARWAARDAAWARANICLAVLGVRHA